MIDFGRYDFIFLDFDGLLVNTEHLHYLAYQQMCTHRGVTLDWDFASYCEVAHASSEGIRNKIYKDFPILKQMQPNWAVLYAEKKSIYESLLQEGKVELMPGVDLLLAHLQKLNIPSCVVTNSFRVQIEQIKKQIPLLSNIPYWVTREEYAQAKPSPDPYLTAKSKYADLAKRILGFEDTVRGWNSLHAAQVEGVVISSYLSQEFQTYLLEQGVSCFSSFNELFSS